jgi:RHS repeat-associated protein
VYTYNYDADHHLTYASLGVGSTQGPQATLGYDTQNRLSEVDRASPGGATLTSSFLYDSDNRLTTLTHSNGASPLATYTYHYDNASRVDGYSGIEGTRSYAYDNTNQLTTVTNAATSAVLESYAYDLNGNRTSANGHTYGAPGTGNRLTSDGVYSYAYDAEGNLTTMTLQSDPTKVATYTWDYRDRLTEVRSNLGGTTYDDVFTYDVIDRRIGKSINGGTTQWTVYDGGNPYVDFTGSTLSNRYLYGLALDSLVARTDGSAGNTVWYLTDRLGSVRQLANAAGSVADTITYDSFGKMLSELGSGDRFKYTGREWDSETGLYNYRARYYYAFVGGFIGEDPLGFGAGDANLYRYVGNGPTNDSDALGLQRPGQPPNPAPAPNPGTAPPGQPANPTTGSNNAQQQQQQQQQLRGNIRTRIDLCRQNASLTAQLNGLQAQIDRLIEMGGDPDVINALVFQSNSIRDQIDRNQLAINRANYAIGYRYREDIR